MRLKGLKLVFVSYMSKFSIIFIYFAKRIEKGKNNNSIDKRKSVICLSNKGKKMIEKINPEIIKFRNDGWKNLSDQDLNDLKRIMQTIYQNFN